MIDLNELEQGDTVVLQNKEKRLILKIEIVNHSDYPFFVHWYNEKKRYILS